MHELSRLLRSTISGSIQLLFIQLLFMIMSLYYCTCVYLSCGRYQHSRHLVSALNQFADVKADLPSGWEKKLNKQGKVSCN